MRNLWIFIAIFMVAQLECTKVSTVKDCGQKKRCTKLKGNCQTSEKTCSGKNYEGKNYCKLFKSCNCCVEKDCEATTLSPCKQLGGRCIGANEKCDGCEVPGGSKKFCKDFKTCKCCFPACSPGGDECYPVEGKCSEKGAYCEKPDSKCKEGYEGVKEECKSKDGACQCCKPTQTSDECYPVEGKCYEKGAYCEKLDSKCKEGYEGVKEECKSKDGACQCCKPTQTSDECYPVKGKCSEKGAYCEKLDSKCNEGYEGVKEECESNVGPCQCCKPTQTSNACESKEGRCKGEGKYCEDLNTDCKEGYEGKEAYCVKSDGSSCQCCIPKSSSACAPKEGRCTGEGEYCQDLNTVCKKGYEGKEAFCVKSDGSSCQCCIPKSSSACAPKEGRCKGEGEYCEELSTKCKEGYEGKEAFCVKSDGSSCQCCIPKSSAVCAPKEGRCKGEGEYCEDLSTKCKKGYEGKEAYCVKSDGTKCQCCIPKSSSDGWLVVN